MVLLTLLVDDGGVTSSPQLLRHAVGQSPRVAVAAVGGLTLTVLLLLSELVLEQNGEETMRPATDDLTTIVVGNELGVRRQHAGVEERDLQLTEHQLVGPVRSGRLLQFGVPQQRLLVQERFGAQTAQELQVQLDVQPDLFTQKGFEKLLGQVEHPVLDALNAFPAGDQLLLRLAAAGAVDRLGIGDDALLLAGVLDLGRRALLGGHDILSVVWVRW